MNKFDDVEPIGEDEGDLGMVLNELWGLSDQAEIDRRASAGEGLVSEDVAEAVYFMLTRPRNVTIRDLVMLPRCQDL